VLTQLNVNKFPARVNAEAHYLNKVDEHAEAVRGAFITQGSGQAMTYMRKSEEAKNPGGGPLLQAEAQALGISVSEVVASVTAANAAWEQAGIQIETARLVAKKQVREAQTASEMHAIVKLLPTV